MKLTITKNQIKTALGMVADVAQRSGTMPVLQNILMRGEGGILTLTASDMEAQVTTSIQADCEDFAITIPAAKFKAIIGTLDDNAEITLTLKDEKLTVKSGKSRHNVQTLPADSFPVSVASGKSISIELAQEQFKTMLAGVAHAMGNGHVKAYLNGVGFTSNYVAATDGARAAICNHAFGGDFNAIIPAKSVHRLIKMLNEGPMMAEIFSEKVRFEIGDVELIVKLVDGKYPDVTRFFFNPSGEPVKLSKDDLLSCIESASIQLPKHNGGNLIIENGSMSITCRDGGQESADEIDVEYAGQRIESAYNLVYLRDAASAVGSAVSIGIGGNIEGTMLITGADSELKCVVTPMRI